MFIEAMHNDSVLSARFDLEKKSRLVCSSSKDVIERPICLTTTNVPSVIYVIRIFTMKVLGTSVHYRNDPGS